MTDISWLNIKESEMFFGKDGFHIPVNLTRLKEARILWINQKFAAIDPNFKSRELDPPRYEEHILASCAYVLSEEVSSDGNSQGDVMTGYADRYGGSGIGHNGGSGRAAVVNGYLVKGIGRTPLVSALTETSHASGGAYLEESVREAIFAEIVGMEFPCSAIPVLAIIDTGLAQIWQTPNGPKIERRVLLVRPSFLRPAHFARASGFYSGNNKEGVRDTSRVRQMFDHGISVFGKDGLCDIYEEFWLNWAQQLAYSFAHRLPHGSNTISNICLSGMLLDFGATSSVPSWANIATMLSRQPFKKQIDIAPKLIRSSAYYFGRYLDAKYDTEEGILALVQAAREKYRFTLISETLRLCGISNKIAEEAAVGDTEEAIFNMISSVISHYQKERIDMVESVPIRGSAWDLRLVWDDVVPGHLVALRELLDKLVADIDREKTAERCRFLAMSRENLFREGMKSAIFSNLDGKDFDPAEHRQFVENYINEQVSEGRRDHREDLPDAVPAGFAISSSSSYVIFRDIAGKEVFAVKEQYPARVNDKKILGLSKRIAVSSLSATSIQFKDGEISNFEGCVKMH